MKFTLWRSGFLRIFGGNYFRISLIINIKDKDKASLEIKYKDYGSDEDENEESKEESKLCVI